MRGARGFTFIELLIVSTILIILASAVMPLAKVANQRQKEAELRRSLREMRTAIDKFKDAVDMGLIPATEIRTGSEGYPPDLETLVEGVTVANDASGRKLKFLRRIPIDPLTNSTEWGMRAYQDRPDAFVLGRTERVRRLHEGDGHRARRHEVQGLVAKCMMSNTRVVRQEIPRPRVASGCSRVPSAGLHAHRAAHRARRSSPSWRRWGSCSTATACATRRRACSRTDLFRMRDAIDQYYADKNKYPASLDTLVSDGYMRKIPEDPITQSADTWQTVPAEPDPSNPTAEPGIYDVKSGAQGTALDGSTYADW